LSSVHLLRQAYRHPRVALISAAVAGKIDVREEAASWRPS